MLNALAHAARTIFYAVYRVAARLLLRLLFGRIEVTGLEHVPRKSALLLIGNHTNGPLDPMLPLAMLGRRLTLTANERLRRHPVLGPLSCALGVITVERCEEEGLGAETSERRRAKNRSALGRCLEALAGGGAVLIFPEGKSHSDPDMHPFKIGAALLAQR